MKPNEPALLPYPGPKRRPAIDRRVQEIPPEDLPEITASLKESGVEDAEIYLMGARMLMILEVNDYFSFEAKARADQKNPKVQEWEELMWKLSNRCRRRS